MASLTRKIINVIFGTFGVVLCTVFLFSCGISKRATTHTSYSEQVVEFAEQQWDLVYKKIPEGMESQFGFQSHEDMVNAKMGNPIEMYYWGENNIVKSQTYRVPVLVNGKMVSFLTVSAGEEMTTGDFGGSQLAQTIQIIADQYNVEPYGILRIYSITSDFFIFDNHGIFNFISISSHNYNSSEPKNILDIEDIRQLIVK